MQALLSAGLHHFEIYVHYMLHQYFCSPSELFCVFLCLFRLRLFRILKYLPCTCNVPSQPKYIFPFGNIPFFFFVNTASFDLTAMSSPVKHEGHQITRISIRCPGRRPQRYQHETWSTNTWQVRGKHYIKLKLQPCLQSFFSPPLFCVFLFIPFKYTSSHKVNRLWVSLLLHFFHARSGKTLRSCHCFSRKTLADLVSLIPGTLRVLAELGRIYSGVFGINPMWLSNELGTIRGGSR